MGILLALTGTMAIGLLAGCAAAENAAHGGATLSSTKASVQLLRNEAASRVPPGAIGEVSETDDTSIACESEEGDPKGLSRSWRSSVLLSIESGSTWRVLAMGQHLADSFTADGWVASRALSEAVPNSLLQSDGSLTTIELAVTLPGADAAAEPAMIRIVSTGPCVNPDGADSDEIRKLDSKG